MNRRILVVDDNVSMVRTICDILRLKGWEPHTAHSGEDAVDFSSQEPYDAVLMDIVMPGIDGITAFRRIKALRPGLQVILMTAHVAPEMLQHARQEGAIVLTKPFEISSLMALLP